MAALDSCVAASVDDEELFMEQRLACELDGDRTRCGGAMEPRRCVEDCKDWLKSYAGDRQNLLEDGDCLE